MITRARTSPSPPAPGLSVAAVARRLGVAPATLRTWDRRYGLGPSEHVAGAHRRYSRQDVERLMVMRRLTLDGVAPGDAARAALGTDDAQAGLLVDPVRSPAAVIDAALAGDEQLLAELVRLRDGQDVVTWWSDLVGPVRDLLARRTLLDRPGQDAEAAFTQAVLGALRALVGAARLHPSSAVVLLLTPVGAARSLTLHVVAAAVPDIDARVVSGPMSSRRLIELVTMTHACAVVTVSERPGDDLSLVARLREACPQLSQLVLVPPDDFARIPTGPAVQRSRSVPGLIHELRALVTVGGEQSR